MRRILLVLAIVGLALMAAVPAQAGWGHRHCGYGWGHGGWGYGGYRGCGYGPYYSGYGFSIGCYRPSFIYNSCYGGGYYGGGYYGGYGGYGGYYNPLPIGYYGYYGSTYNPGSNFVGLSVSPNLAAARPTAPVVVRNLLDLSREELLAVLRTPSDALPRAGGGPRVTTITAEKPALRISNAEQRRKAEQHLAVGDVLFREQKFHSALQRYKLAGQTAPDMAEAYWRQGHALVATANFELAGGAFKRAIAIDPDITRGDFKLEELYGPAAMAKAAHLESLAGWALTRSDSSEPYFLMGVQLHFDGQADRAARFFDRAADLAGRGSEHVLVFAPMERAPADRVPTDPGLVPPPPEAEAPVVETKPAPAVAVSAAVEI